MPSLNFEKLSATTASIYIITRTALVLAGLLIMVHLFVFTVTRVAGTSMEPTLKDGQSVFIDKLSYWQKAAKRGDIVMLRFPGDPEKVRYMKRVIGLPGELVTLDGRHVLINNKPLIEDYLVRSNDSYRKQQWRLGKDEYFLLGDNRRVSNDSRSFGPVEQRHLIGQARLILWPVADQAVLTGEVLP